MPRVWIFLFRWRPQWPVLSLLVAAVACSSASGLDIVGYVPDYRMTSSTYKTQVLPGQIALLDEVRYFGITVNSNGTLTTTTTDLNNLQTIQNIIGALPAASRPRLDITLGGAGESAGFSAVAADPNKQALLAANIKNLMDQTGATAVDFDWEHPAAGVERTTLYPAMLGLTKQVLGSNRRVYATVDPTVIINSNVFAGGTNAIDGVNLMTYDLGWWGNDPQNPNNAEHSLPQYVSAAVDAWTSPAGTPIPASYAYVKDYVYGTPWGNNAPANQIGVGLPFYGHSVTGSDITPSYAELVAGGTSVDGNYYTYQGKSVWIPGLDLVEQRIEFAHERNLQSVFIWELAHDLSPDNANSMLRRAYATNQRYLGDYDGNGTAGPEDYDVWKSTFGRTSGDMRADGNQDGMIDSADYTFWRDRMTAGDGGSAATNLVPEPSTALSAFLLVVLGLLRRRR